MVRKADKSQDETVEPGEGNLFDIPDDRLNDPYAYKEAIASILKKLGKGEISPLKHKQIRQELEAACEANTGLTIKQILQENANPLIRFTHLMDLSIDDAKKLIPAIQRVDDLRLSAEKKSEYIAWIERIGAIQEECRSDSVKCMIYVMRDAEPCDDPARMDSTGAGFLYMQPFHLTFHEVMNDERFPRSIIMCHPGTGKSFNVMGWVSCEIGHKPGLRVLLIQDTKEKPEKSIQQLKAILKSSRFRALFPAVRVLECRGVENSAQRFTVTRANMFSKEPTFEAASIGSKINGNGYDLILGDDVCPEDVKRQPSLRQTLNNTWKSVVEPRLRGRAGKGRIRMVGTPWHAEDVLGMIRKRVEAGKLKGWRLAIDEFAIKDDANGKAIPIWPERWGSSWYEEQKEWLGDLYALNFRLQSVENRYRAVQRMWWFNSRTSDSCSTEFDKQRMDAILQSERWLSIDPAATKGAQSCDNGVIDAVITPSGHAAVLDVDFVQGNATEMCDWIIRRVYYAPQPGYRYIQFEAQGAMTGQVHLWGQMITEALRTGMIPDKEASGNRVVTQLPACPSIPTIINSGVKWSNRQNMNKLDRLKEVIPMIENAYVHFAGCRVLIPGKDGTGLRVIPDSRMDRFRDILTHFDGTNNADAVDALTQWLLYNRQRIADSRVRAAAQNTTGRVDAFTAAFRERLDAPSRMESENEPYGDELAFYAGKVA